MQLGNKRPRTSGTGEGTGAAFAAIGFGEKPAPLPQRDKVTPAPNWKIGGGLTERDQLNVLLTLKQNNDRFAYSLEDLDQYTGPPMEVRLNTDKDIFRPPHKLADKEWTFIGEQC